MADRKTISKNIRFEIFKRDSFTCQYCGRKAPDVLLHIDHIKPISKGGNNDILNLITSCQECNLGKSDRELGDDAVIKRQRDQLEELQERKEQIEMMFEWKKGLLELEDSITNQLSDFWNNLTPGYNLNDAGKKELSKLKRKFTIDEIMDAMKIAHEQYIVISEGKCTHESVENAWGKVSGICANKKRDSENPSISRLFYIRGILRNRFGINESYAIELLKEAYEFNANIDSLERLAKTAKTWSAWRYEIESFVEEQRDSGIIKRDS